VAASQAGLTRASVYRTTPSAIAVSVSDWEVYYDGTTNLSITVWNPGFSEEFMQPG
jgi:hypothetical protein